MISIIDLVLSLLSAVIPQLVSNKAAPEVIALIQSAIDSLNKVQNTPVTYSQLEGMRVKPTF